MILETQALSCMRDRRWQWLVGVVVVLSLYSWVPEPTQWLPQLRALDGWFWPIFLLLQWACALFMVPSLPLVFVAALVFPESAWLVLGMALCGVAGSSALIYHWAEALGFARMFDADTRAQRAKRWIQRYGGAALAVWAATPFLPTDLGCYLAASAKMRFSTYVFASVLGEAVLCASVIWGAQGMLAIS